MWSLKFIIGVVLFFSSIYYYFEVRKRFKGLREIIKESINAVLEILNIR